MKLTTTVKAIDHGLMAFRKKLELLSLRKSYVKAGIMGGQHAAEKLAHATDKKRDRFGRYTKPIVERTGSLSNAQLASIHEFGLSTAPARPFVRPPFMANKAAYLEILRSAYAQAMLSNNSDMFRRALALVGQKMAADIKGYVTSGPGVPPPLAASTIKAKGSTRPLVDTGQMINSVTYEVVE